MSKLTCFIIHGAYGNPEENWFPWLKSELELLGHKVISPVFPTPQHQNLDNWLRVMEVYKNSINENTIFVGHSLAPAFILSVIENVNKPILACFFVSGFLSILDNPDFDKINHTFTSKAFNWDKIKNNCKKFYLYHSDNDPYVPLEKANELANMLDTKVNIIFQGGHINYESGFDKFPVLLKDIKVEIIDKFKKNN